MENYREKGRIWRKASVVVVVVDVVVCVVEYGCVVVVGRVV